MSEHILIADDSLTLRRVIQHQLQPLGFRFSTAGDGAAALRMASEQRPDLILLDHQMPVHEGPEVCQRLLAHPETRAIPVVIASGLTDQQEQLYDDCPNVVSRLPKPFSPEALRDHVTRAIKPNHTSDAASKPASEPPHAQPPAANADAANAPTSAVTATPPTATAAEPDATEEPLPIALLLADHDQAEAIRRAIVDQLTRLGFDRGQYRIRIASSPAMARVLLKRQAPALLVFGPLFADLAQSGIGSEASLRIRFDQAAGGDPMSKSAATGDLAWGPSPSGDRVAAALRRALLASGRTASLAPDVQTAHQEHMAAAERHAADDDMPAALEALDQADHLLAPDLAARQLRQRYTRELRETWCRQAEADLEAGRLTEAGVQIDRLQRRWPQDERVQALQKALDEHEQAGQLDRWHEEATQALERGELDAARHVLRQMRAAAARHALTQAIVSALHEAEHQAAILGLCQQAREHLEAGDLPATQDLIKQARVHDPNHDEVRAVAQQLARQQESDELAERLRMGQEQLAAGQLDAAAEQQRAARLIDPDHPEVLQLGQAIAAARLDQEIAGHHERAEQQAAAGQLDQALRTAREALWLDPDRANSQALVERLVQDQREASVAELVAEADRCVNQEDWERGQRALKEAQQLAPDRADLDQRMADLTARRERAWTRSLRQQAEAAAEAQRLDEALRLLKQGQTLQPHDADLADQAERLNLLILDRDIDALQAEAERFQSAGNLPAAWSKLEAAKRLDPTRADTIEKLEELKQSVRQQQADKLVTNATSLRDKGLYDEAIDKLKRAKKLCPHHPDVDVLLEDVHSRKNHESDAEIHLPRELADEPHDDGVPVLNELMQSVQLPDAASQPQGSQTNG